MSNRLTVPKNFSESKECWEPAPWLRQRLLKAKIWSPPRHAVARRAARTCRCRSLLSAHAQGVPGHLRKHPLPEL